MERTYGGLTPYYRFWAHVQIGGLDECWNWTRSVSRLGYGQLRFRKKIHSAHRIAWVLTFPDIPIVDKVLHRCDNRRCCNPIHLFLGSQADNMRDMAAKNRNFKAIGEKNGRAKITNAQVLEILEMSQNGITQTEIAKKFSLASSRISQIVSANQRT